MTDEGTRIALRPDPTQFWRWCGHVLGKSLFSPDAKANSRQEIVQQLIG